MANNNNNPVQPGLMGAGQPVVRRQLNLDPIRYLNGLKPYNGNRDELFTFIDLVNRIFPLLTEYEELAQNIFFDIIKSKLEGKAREASQINYRINTWVDLRNMLCNHFGDRLTRGD